MEAESRLHTADYVEARGILLPAVEYLRRAVEMARTQDKLTGDLLSLVSSHVFPYNLIHPTDVSLLGRRSMHESRQRIVVANEQSVLSTSTCTVTSRERVTSLRSANPSAEVSSIGHNYIMWLINLSYLEDYGNLMEGLD